jgi:hypothetical protein
MQTFPKDGERGRVAWRSRAAALTGLIAAAACTRDPAGGAVPAGERSEGSSIASPEIAGRFALTDAKLSSYLAYQHRMLQLYASRLDGGGSDAGGSLSKLAEAEEDARKKSGLSRHELSAIEQMVRAVIGKRVYGATPPSDDSLERMKALHSKLSGERREEVGRSIADLEKTREEFARLTEERRQYGDANVDLLLAREAELTRSFKEAMATFVPRPTR